jgi:hypothetical protein
MIFNKFQLFADHFKPKALSIRLLAFCLISFFSCNKTSNINGNKSFVALTHLAYGVGAIQLSLNGKPVFPDSLSFGKTTGYDGNPYDTTISQISLMKIYLAGDTSVNVSGNAAFRQGGQYSIFFFDSLDYRSVSLIILQDNPTIRTDTFTYYRYMNFSPGDTLWGLKLINNRKDNPYAADTVVIQPSLFVGFNNIPSAYPINNQIRSGNYKVFAFRDSSNPAPDRSNFDSLGNFQIDSMVNYNIYLQGFYGDTSTANKFQLQCKALN